MLNSMRERERPKRRIEDIFGEVVRQRRKRLGLSQEKLALEADIHRTFLSEIERGIKSPTLTTIEAIAQALETVPSALLHDVEQQRAMS